MSIILFIAAMIGRGNEKQYARATALDIIAIAAKQMRMNAAAPGRPIGACRKPAVAIYDEGLRP